MEQLRVTLDATLYATLLKKIVRVSSELTLQ